MKIPTCACTAIRLWPGMTAVEQDAITHRADVCRPTSPGFISFATYADEEVSA